MQAAGWAPPSLCTDGRRFAGLANHCRKFVRDCKFSTLAAATQPPELQGASLPICSPRARSAGRPRGAAELPADVRAAAPSHVRGRSSGASRGGDRGLGRFDSDALKARAALTSAPALRKWDPAGPAPLLAARSRCSPRAGQAPSRSSRAPPLTRAASTPRRPGAPATSSTPSVRVCGRTSEAWIPWAAAMRAPPPPAGGADGGPGRGMQGGAAGVPMRRGRPCSRATRGTRSRPAA